VPLRRLTIATFVCSAAVLGVSYFLSNGHAQAARITHTCSAADKQFIDTVSSNMTQLTYWSDSLVSDDVDPPTVVHQARAEADQIDATRPTDPTFGQARPLLKGMFVQYAKAVDAKYSGGDAGVYMGLSYTLANEVHDLLVKAQPALAAKGCDPTRLLNGG
jgi:hypothetical protein